MEVGEELAVMTRLLLSMLLAYTVRGGLVKAPASLGRLTYDDKSIKEPEHASA
jgi:hypothetical protein